MLPSVFACRIGFGLTPIFTNDSATPKMLLTSKVVKNDPKKVAQFKGSQSLTDAA